LTLRITETPSLKPVESKLTNRLGQTMELADISGDLRISIGEESIWIQADHVDAFLGVIHRIAGD